MSWFNAQSLPFLSTIALLISPIFASVIITGEYEPDNHVYMCKGGTTVLTCNTTSHHGFLKWKIGDATHIFVGSDEGDTESLSNSITLKLTGIEISSSGMIIYTSTAKLQNVRQEKTAMCSDSVCTHYYSVKLATPSQPTWSPQSCTYTDRYHVQLSWNKPLIGSECCAHYQVNMSTGVNVTTINTEMIIDVNESILVSVNCVDLTGMLGPHESHILIDTGAIESVTIRPVKHSGSGLKYQVTWVLKDFDYGGSNYITCKPQIKSTSVYCNSSSTSVSANVHRTGRAYCNVGRDFKVTGATVVITYAAGFSIQHNATFEGDEDAGDKGIHAGNEATCYGSLSSSCFIVVVLVACCTFIMTLRCYARQKATKCFERIKDGCKCLNLFSVCSENIGKRMKCNYCGKKV